MDITFLLIHFFSFILQLFSSKRGIRIHRGNTDKDTSGCLLVGENKVKVVNSTKYELELTNILKKAQQNGDIIIEIKKLKLKLLSCLLSLQTESAIFGRISAGSASTWQRKQGSQVA